MNILNPDRLKYIRENILKFTQGAFAGFLGLSQRDVSQFEAGKKKFIPNEYIHFLNKIGFDLNQILTNDEDFNTYLDGIEYLNGKVRSKMRSNVRSNQEDYNEIDSKKVISEMTPKMTPNVTPNDQKMGSNVGSNPVKEVLKENLTEDSIKSFYERIISEKERTIEALNQTIVSQQQTVEALLGSAQQDARSKTA